MLDISGLAKSGAGPAAPVRAVGHLRRCGADCAADAGSARGQGALQPARPRQASAGIASATRREEAGMMREFSRPSGRSAAVALAAGGVGACRPDSCRSASRACWPAARADRGGADAAGPLRRDRCAGRPGRRLRSDRPRCARQRRLSEGRERGAESGGTADRSCGARRRQPGALYSTRALPARERDEVRLIGVRVQFNADIEQVRALLHRIEASIGRSCSSRPCRRSPFPLFAARPRADRRSGRAAGCVRRDTRQEGITGACAGRTATRPANRAARPVPSALLAL